MPNYIAIARAWLELNVHPHAFWFLLTGISFGAVWLVRKKLPGLWLWFESFGPENATLARVVEGLPATLLGALLGLAATADPAAALKGALFGAFAPIWHHIMKSYRGEVSEKVVKRIVLPLIVLVLPGCGGASPALPSGECLDEYIRITAVHQAMLVKTCLPADDIEACVDRQPEIDAEANRELDQWEKRCKQ